MDLMNKPTWVVDDLAQVIGLEVSTIKRKISNSPKDLPPFARIGRGHVWLPKNVLEWINEQTKTRVQPVQANIEPKVKTVGNQGAPHRGRGRPRKVAIDAGGAA